MNVWRIVDAWPENILYIYQCVKWVCIWKKKTECIFPTNVYFVAAAMLHQFTCFLTFIKCLISYICDLKIVVFKQE